jgi:hypothetical protein
MRRPDLLKTMVDKMINHGAKSEQIREFHNYWARLSPGYPMPCPICYLGRTRQQLLQLPVDERLEKFTCPSCQSIFEVRRPDK